MNRQPIRPAHESVTFALVLGFIPTTIALVVGALDVPGYPKATGMSLLLVACVSSVACCFVSSRMLFSRNTPAAIAGGLLLLILNVLIAVFLGCVALMKGA